MLPMNCSLPVQQPRSLASLKSTADKFPAANRAKSLSFCAENSSIMPPAGQNKMAIQTPSVFSCALIADELAGVSEFFDAQLDCHDGRLKPFIDYLKNRQGKMLRASFVLLCGRLFGPATPLHIKVAAITEMMHAATLLHDDVIDGGIKRRYHATANNLWGANFAVLLGDFLLSRAFAAVASLQRDDINRLLV